MFDVPTGSSLSGGDAAPSEAHGHSVSSNIFGSVNLSDNNFKKLGILAALLAAAYFLINQK